VLLLVIAIGCYTLGRHSSGHEIDGYRTTNVQLASDNKRLKDLSDNQKKQIEDLRYNLTSAQSQLDVIFRPDRQLEINANESMMIASGGFAIGLVGNPSNDSVNINVNGKQQSVAAGGVVNVAISTSCRVEVKSFEMFKAVVMATCAQTQP
jgi:hypothetical protein